MTPEQIAADVDRGLVINAKLEELKKELKAIEDRLETAALEGETVPLEDGTREGRQFLAAGLIGTVPIVIESDQIIGSFAEGSEIEGRLKAMCEARIAHLFRRVVKFERVPKDGKAFRQTVAEYWPAAEAAKIIDTAITRDKNGIAKNRIIIAWDRAKA